MLALAVAAMVAVAMVPGKLPVDMVIPFFVVLVFVCVGLLLNWIGTAADRSEEGRPVRLIAYRIVAGFLLIYYLLGITAMIFSRK
jgi:hypothetical protein